MVAPTAGGHGPPADGVGERRCGEYPSGYADEFNNKAERLRRGAGTRTAGPSQPFPATGIRSDIEGAVREADNGVHVPPQGRVRLAQHNNLTESYVRQGVLGGKNRSERRSWNEPATLERAVPVHRTCQIRGLKLVDVYLYALRVKDYPAFGAPSV